MLRDSDAMATVAVADLDAARRFYRDSLGLAEDGPMPPEMGVATFRSGATRIVVYQSEFAGTNRATSVTWGVGGDFDDVVAALQKANVPFEHYDMEGLPREGDVHAAGDFKAVWFRDPDGNILHVNNE